MKKTYKVVPVYFITIKDGGSGGKSEDEDYYLDALNEFERRLVGCLKTILTITVNPVDKCSMIMFSSDEKPKKKSKIPSKDELVHMAFEIEKDFDFKISCAVEVKPEEEEK